MEAVQTLSDLVIEFALKHGISRAQTEGELRKLPPRYMKSIPRCMKEATQEDAERFQVILPGLMWRFTSAKVSWMVSVTMCKSNGIEIPVIRIRSSKAVILGTSKGNGTDPLDSLGDYLDR